VMHIHLQQMLVLYAKRNHYKGQMRTFFSVL
jgi:hypothetical protein